MVHRFAPAVVAKQIVAELQRMEHARTHAAMSDG